MRRGIFLILFFYIASCSVELDYEDHYFEPKLVINGFLRPDSLVSVNVRSTMSVLSNEITFIENATVNLFVNGEFIESLVYNCNGDYKSENHRPSAGDVYSIEVIADGYDTVTATDTIPEIVKILSATKARGNTFDEYGDPDTDYTVRFVDGSGNNYYELMFIGQSSPTEFNSNFSIGFNEGVIIADPVMKNDSDLDLYPPTFLFSDYLINGEDYTLSVKMNGGSGGDFTSPIVPPYESGFFVVLRSASHSYYQYMKSWYRHKLGKQVGNKVEAFALTPLLSDPVKMYSNIEGGYGIFTSYNQSYYKTEIIEN
jgi:hypothetical protein